MCAQATLLARHLVRVLRVAASLQVLDAGSFAIQARSLAFQSYPSVRSCVACCCCMLTCRCALWLRPQLSMHAHIMCSGSEVRTLRVWTGTCHCRRSSGTTATSLARRAAPASATACSRRCRRRRRQGCFALPLHICMQRSMHSLLAQGCAFSTLEP